jgi:hypothetical protein
MHPQKVAGAHPPACTPLLLKRLAPASIGVHWSQPGKPDAKREREFMGSWERVSLCCSLASSSIEAPHGPKGTRGWVQLDWGQSPAGCVSSPQSICQNQVAQDPPRLVQSQWQHRPEYRRLSKRVESNGRTPHACTIKLHTADLPVNEPTPMYSTIAAYRLVE